MMEGLVLVLLFVAGALAKEDLNRKVFLFPNPSDTDHVILKPKAEKPLRQVSVCLESYTQLSRSHGLFSVATPEFNHTLFILSRPPDSVMVSVNQENNYFRIDEDTLNAKHTCVTWDCGTGVLQLWINGKLYPRRVTSKGFAIKTNTSVVLGQEQYFFDMDRSFVGEISNVNMWDFVLTPKEIKSVISRSYHGNLINWRSLNYKIQGDVQVQPKLQYKSQGV